ncbi:hypothetical protein D9Q98_005368 [Chlorella vulgaris]|uniref:Uncharacterized protein n=1 Tax=Chlorella vulgaris TaxID=3077 RepID=A0A9D4TLU9_CHLVU|nr:hypothetical protein D9Q98_005368 [Chlorella vulgaris]
MAGSHAVAPQRSSTINGVAAAASPSRRPLPLQLRLLRRLEQTAALIAVFTQLALFIRSRDVPRPAKELARQAALGLLRAGALSVALCLPDRLWLKYRVALIVFFRAAITLAHTLSEAPGQAEPSLFTARPASPGFQGAVQDWLRVAVGTRLLVITVTGSILQLQPLAVVLLQTMLFAASADMRAVCSTQLLTDALSQRRLVGVRQVLEVAVPVLGPIWSHAAQTEAWRPEQSSRQGSCLTMLIFQHLVVGVVVPVVVAAHTSLPDWKAEEQQQHLEQEPQQQQSPALGLWQQHAAALIQQVQQLAAAAGRAWSRANDGLTQLCRWGALPPHQTFVLIVLLLANLYLLSQAAAFHLIADQPL